MYENRTCNLKPVIDGDFVVRPPRESWEMGEGINRRNRRITVEM